MFCLVVVEGVVVFVVVDVVASVVGWVAAVLGIKKPPFEIV